MSKAHPHAKSSPVAAKKAVKVTRAATTASQVAATRPARPATPATPATPAMPLSKAVSPPAHPSHDHGPHAPMRPFDVHPETLERASGFFRALGDPQRLRLLGHLLAGERCVTDLADVFDEGLSTISQRLRVLRAERLVHRRRDGKHIYYALADDHVRDLLQSAIEHASEKHHGHDEED